MDADRFRSIIQHPADAHPDEIAGLARLALQRVVGTDESEGWFVERLVALFDVPNLVALRRDRFPPSEIDGRIVWRVVCLKGNQYHSGEEHPTPWAALDAARESAKEE